MQEVGARDAAVLEVVGDHTLATGRDVEDRGLAERRTFEDHEPLAVG